MAGLQSVLNPEEVGAAASTGMAPMGEPGSESEDRRLERRRLALPVLCVGCRRKEWPRFRVGLLTPCDLYLGWVSHLKSSSQEKFLTGVAAAWF